MVQSKRAWSFQSDYQHECEIGLGVCSQSSSISGNTKAANKGNSFPVSGGWFALPCGERVRHANPGKPCHCHQPSVFGGAVANSVCASTDWPLPGEQLTHELLELLLPTIEQRGETSDVQRSSFTCNRLGAHVLQGQWQWQTAGTEGVKAKESCRLGRCADDSISGGW